MTAAALDLALAPRRAGRPSSTTRSTSSSPRPRSRSRRFPRRRPAQPADGVEEAAALLAGAERPVIMAGSGLYWGHGEEELRALAEALGIPVFLNGLGRGCLPADHELAFSRARGTALQGADVALVVGVPMDFRLGFGGSFGEETKIVRLDAAPNAADRQPRCPRSTWSATSRPTLAALREAAGAPGRTGGWLEQLREVEAERRAGEQAELERPALAAAPGARLRGAGPGARSRRDRDRRRRRLRLLRGPLHRHLPAGCWMDPGPFGCLGAGPGQAIGAKLAHPERQVCLLLGDGAFGFAGMEFDTMARHGLGVVGVMGNNGIWALEHHPMKFLYGYSVAAELRPETRYDQLVESLGCDGHPRPRPGRAAPGAGARLRVGPPDPGQRAHRPRGRLPAQIQPGLTGSQRARTNRPPLLTADSSWPLRTGRGTSSGTSLFVGSDGGRRHDAAIA